MIPHALWRLVDAIWQACGLPCTRGMFRRQEMAIARDWAIYEAGLKAGRQWQG